MNKKILLGAIIALSVFAAGCGNASGEVKPTSTPTPSISPVVTATETPAPEHLKKTVLIKKDKADNGINLALGTSYAEVEKFLNDNKITITDKDTEKSLFGDWNYKTIETKDYDFTFYNKEHTLSRIMVKTDILSSYEGLKVGDTLDTMKELCGTEFTRYADPYEGEKPIYEYVLNDYYFGAHESISDKPGVVSAWSIYTITEKDFYDAQVKNMKK